MGKECIFVGKGVISLGKEILFMRHLRGAGDRRNDGQAAEVAAEPMVGDGLTEQSPIIKAAQQTRARRTATGRVARCSLRVAGYLPAQNMDASCFFTRSEQPLLDHQRLMVLSCLDLTLEDLLVFCPFSSRQPSQTTSRDKGIGAWNSTSDAWTMLLLRLGSISFQVALRTSTSALQRER